MFENRVCFSVRGEFGAQMKLDSEAEIPREELERSIDKNVLLKMMCLDQLGYTGEDVTFISTEEYDKQYGDDDDGVAAGSGEADLREPETADDTEM